MQVSFDTKPERLDSILNECGFTIWLRRLIAENVLIVTLRIRYNTSMIRVWDAHAHYPGARKVQLSMVNLAPQAPNLSSES